MTSTVEQKISDLVDGELDANGREQLYKQLKNNEQCQKTWARYCLISDALKSNLPSNPKHDLAQRIKFSLESEPVYFSPAKPASTHENELSDVAALPVAAFADGRRQPSRFGLGMAAAASIAMVSLVSVFVVGESKNDEQLLSTVQTVNTQGIMGSTVASNSVQFVAAPLSAGIVAHPGNALVPNGQWERLPSSNSSDLEKFLIEHSETSSQSFSPNMFPYARVVGFEAGTNGSK